MFHYLALVRASHLERLLDGDFLVHPHHIAEAACQQSVLRGADKQHLCPVQCGLLLGYSYGRGVGEFVEQDVAARYRLIGVAPAHAHVPRLAVERGGGEIVEAVAALMVVVPFHAVYREKVDSVQTADRCLYLLLVLIPGVARAGIQRIKVKVDARAKQQCRCHEYCCLKYVHDCLECNVNAADKRFCDGIAR